MGCFWSKDDGVPKCAHCGRRAVNNLVIRDHSCECCIARAKRRQEFQRIFLYGSPDRCTPTPALCSQGPQKACFGEYKCPCGRFWNSRLSWTNCYQICKRCRGRVFPFKQRELLSSDITVNEKGQEHPKEMCQMCQQLGKYCGNFRQGIDKKTRTGVQNRKRF